MPCTYIFLFSLFAFSLCAQPNKELCDLFKKNRSDKVSILEQVKEQINLGADVNCDCELSFTKGRPAPYKKLYRVFDWMTGQISKNEINFFQKDRVYKSTKYSFKPLTLAIKNQDIETVKYLISKKALPDSGFEYALAFIVTEVAKPELARMLIEQGAKVEHLDIRTIRDVSFLKELVQKHNYALDGLQLEVFSHEDVPDLEQLGVDLHTVDFSERLLDNIDMLNYLVVERGVDYSKKTFKDKFNKEYSLFTRLYQRSKDSAYIPVIKAMVKQGNSPTLVENPYLSVTFKKNLLHFAIEYGYTGLIDFFIEEGIDFSESNRYDKTSDVIKDHVLEENRTSYISKLVKLGWIDAIKAPANHTFDYKIQSIKMLKAMHKEGVDVNDFDIRKCKFDFDSLAVNALIDMNYDFEKWLNSPGQTERNLNYLLAFHLPEFSLLIDKKAIDPNFHLPEEVGGKCRKALLMYVCAGEGFIFNDEHDKFIYKLIRAGADVNAITQCGEISITPLYILFEQKEWYSALLLVQRGALNHVKCGREATALDYLNKIDKIFVNDWKSFKKIKKLLAKQ